MAGLLYREDMDEVRQRLTTWWNGGDIGRPAMQITAPRAEPLERFEPMPAPAGWTGHYSTKSYDYRVHLSKVACANAHYLAEAVPFVAPDLAPNCLALYLGCQGVEMPGTVWCEPIIDSLILSRFDYDPGNLYWQFSSRLGREQVALGRGKFLVQFPDLIEGLDTLAAMRGNDRLLIDLIEHPAWVLASLRKITDRYFHYYDVLYDLFRDEVGGSIFWAWAPGRMAKFQCDFSAMISPAMFADFMVPVLTEMCERVSYCMYHWDGPGAIAHHDHLLSIPRLTMLQWTPGAGVEPTWHERWWPLYHKTVDAGKKVLVSAGNVEHLKALKREFGEKLKHFLIGMAAKTPEQAEEFIRVASF
jgi:5-methyltetrahydrofolate--homocysteine methyltransferase